MHLLEAVEQQVLSKHAPLFQIWWQEEQASPEEQSSPLRLQRRDQTE